MRLVLVAVLVMCWAGPVSAQDPEAVLMSMTGEVMVSGADGATRTGSFGMHLFGGDVVQTQDQSSAEIFFSAGNWIEIGANSNMSIRASRPSEAAPTGGTPQALASVQRFLKLKDSSGTSSVAALRSGATAKDLQLVSPCQTKVRAGNPTFVWRASDPEAELQLTVYDDQGVHWKTTVAGASELTYSSDAPALEAGVTYSWTLETTDPLQFPPLRSTSGFFEVLSPEDDQQVERALAALPQDESVPAWGRQLVVASTLYEFGLLSEAVQHTEKALETTSDNPHVRSILARLYADLGRPAEALAEYEKLMSN